MSNTGGNDNANKGTAHVSSKANTNNNSNRFKYESLNYGRFDKLKNFFLSNDFDAEQTTEIELSNQNSDELPSYIILELMPRLISLILRDNQINEFDAQIILRACPHLEILDLSNNQIDELTNLLELGGLKELKILEISGNPVCKSISRLNILEVLINPQKYQKYDPVKILCAGYQKLPTGQLTQKQELKYKRELQMIQRHPEELEKHELHGTVSKHNHKRTLARLGAEQCPVPRKTRFRNLCILNGQIITKLDLMRIFSIDDVSSILQGPDDAKLKQISQGIKIKKNNALQNEYLRKYQKKISRIYQANQDATTVQKLEGEDEMHYLAKVDDAMAKARSFKINPKIFAAEIWEKPQDIQYKGEKFEISMKDYKKMCRDYEEEKKAKEAQQIRKDDERREKNQDKINKKLAQQGIPDFQDYPEIDDSDIQVRKLFRIRVKQLKPKLDLAKADDLEYNSSESELSERIKQDQRESDLNDSFQFENQQNLNNSADNNELDTLNSTATKSKNSQQKAMMAARRMDDEYEQQNENNLMDIRNQLLEKTKQNEEGGIPRVKRPQQDSHLGGGIGASPGQSSYQPPSKLGQANQVQFRSVHPETLQEIEEKQRKAIELEEQQKKRFIPNFQRGDESPGRGQQRDVDSLFGSPAQPSTFAVDLGIGQNGEPVKLTVSNFQFNEIKNTPHVKQKKKALQVNEIKEQTKSTFDIKNQLFVHHESHKTIDTMPGNSVSSLQQYSHRRPSAGDDAGSDSQIEREKKEQLKEKKPIYYEEEKPKSKITHKPETAQSVARTRGQINLAQITFPRHTINIENLIPTKEQGTDDNFKEAILYNPKTKEHRDLIGFQKNLEEIENLKEQTRIINDLIENPSGVDEAEQFKTQISQHKQAITYDKGFEYLFEDKNFEVQHTYDPVNKFVRQFITKKKEEDGKFSTYDIREIFMKANGYDADKEPPITEKEVNQVLDDYQIDFSKKLQYYKWNETLDNIKLRKNKPSEKNIKRQELKEIERTKSNANLAVHYQMLQKYVSDENLEKNLQKLTAGMFSENQDKIVFQKEKQEDPPHVDNRLKRLENKLGSNHNKNALQQEEKLDHKPQQKDKQKGFVGHIEQLQQEKSAVRPYKPREDVNLTGYIVEFCPNINQIVNSQQYVPPAEDLQSFEEQVDFYQRQIQEKYQKNKQDSGVLSLQNQMMKYAQQFSQKVKNREELQKNITNDIQNAGQLLDQFMEWEQKELATRYDKEYCFLRYVKLQREGKL